MSSIFMPTLACGTWCYAVYVAWNELGPGAAVFAFLLACIGIAAPVFRDEIIAFVRRYRSHA